jgi:DNA-binding MarR family transcriptional regulator
MEATRRTTSDLAVPRDLSLLSPERRRAALIAQAAAFAATFSRWKDEQRCQGLGYEQMRVVQVLSCRGPAIMREIGEMLKISPRNMTVLVDGLQEAGLVTRGAHPEDRRATLLELTAEGEKLSGAEFADRLAEMGTIFDGFTPERQQEFYDAVFLLIETMRPPGGGECC